MIDKNTGYTHKDCIHYQNGFCNLNMMNVNPNGVVCSGFAPRKPMKEDAPVPVARVSQTSVPSIPVSTRGYGMGRRRRGRRRRR